MKRFAAVTLAVLMLLTVFASAASAQDAVEIRGPVFNGSNIQEIVGTDGITIDATQFAAFFYDINDNVTTETLSIRNVPGNNGNVIGEGGLVYETQIQQVEYEFTGAAGWDNYSVIGFFAEKYIPLKPNSADKLAKLVLDSDDRYTIRTGETLDLGEGYALEAKQVDVEGEKVWLEFTKDGEFVDDEIISVVNENMSTWEVELDDIQDEDDVVVFRVHINQVFQGAVDSIAQIEGLWLIDYANAMTIESDDEFGELNDVSIQGDSLVIRNDDSFTLTRDSEEEIAEGMFFKIADTPTNVLRFYVMKELTDPGTYEVRGQVATGDFTWDATNFAGFFYDINDDVTTETLSVSGLEGNVIPEGGLVYNTTIQNVDFEYDEWGQYPVIGFFAEKYIPLKANSADKLAKLILDSDDRYTVRTGETLDLGEGYALEAKQVDVEGEKVWLEFTKDGEFVDDEIISVVNENMSTWEVELDDIQDEDDVVVFRVHINQVFQGAVDSIAQIEGLWLIDYANAMTIESDDEFGELNDVSIQGDSLVIRNDDSFTLTRDSEEEIAEGMFFKIADTPSNELRYYPFVERTVGEGEEPDLEDDEPTVGENVTAPEDDENVTAPEDDENVTEPGETPAEEEPTVGETPEEEPADTPGFGVVLGLVGLLAVVYLVRRNN